MRLVTYVWRLSALVVHWKRLDLKKFVLFFKLLPVIKMDFLRLYALNNRPVYQISWALFLHLITAYFSIFLQALALPLPWDKYPAERVFKNILLLDKVWEGNRFLVLIGVSWRAMLAGLLRLYASICTWNIIKITYRICCLLLSFRSWWTIVYIFKDQNQNFGQLINLTAES